VAINNLGYRNWEGRLGSPWLRWLTIAMVGIQIVFKSQWIKRLMFLAWGPAIGVGGIFFFYEQYVENRDTIQVGIASSPRSQKQFGEMLQLVSSSSQAEVISTAMSKPPNEARGYVWSFVLVSMLRVSQGWMVLVMIGLIAPSLIAKDIRSRAHLFYFSKPITRVDYLVGKFSIVAFFVGFVTLLPVLALYALGVLLSPDALDVIKSTWFLPFRVTVACLIYIVPCCLIGLALSSLTTESRFAGFAWFMVWILGFVGYNIVNNISALGNGMPADDSLWRIISLYDCLTFLQSWVMDLETNHAYAMKLLFFVLLLCLICYFTIMRKISTPLRA